ncbi:LytR C-terminal domain-containing protein [Arthrobacter sulfonylureivorans]|uniref:LytR C-terminal domain-containing protein n=1 Tax=Arthrobacter sulfonylureivorans TaxID=2486855 RepID=A0ABY3W558_9MICC|nr:LytR C-terminal domain-containing protein [Arthrobacter sulfonylureivorans]UNK45384.1 LytR C-terminal domain-containing protein [Arthrobacter sulfonylureivorans]
MTKYPRDEFDQVPETSDRHGVHRARMATPKSNGLGLIILAAVLALAVGALSFFVLPLLGTGGPSTPVAGATSTPAATASASPSATEQESKSAEAEATTEPSDEATSEPTEEAAAVNKQDPVMILNGAGVSGLAGTVSQTVQNDGWAIAAVDNWGGAPLAGSVIFYNPGQEANAQALGELLGITDLQENGDVSQYVTVALGPGYR